MSLFLTVGVRNVRLDLGLPSPVWRVEDFYATPVRYPEQWMKAASIISVSVLDSYFDVVCFSVCVFQTHNPVPSVSGLVVPGYINSRQDAIDPSNLLLLEATPSGIVARPLKTRLERTMSRSVVLLQLCSPGEKRNMDDDYEQSETVNRTRKHVERELRNFRDRWTELGSEKGYKWIHSTISLGGALAYQLGLGGYLAGPVSPSAYIVLMGLHKAAAGQNISEKENRAVTVEDFLRDHRFEEKHSLRLRPGWRFLAPIPLRETSKS